MAQKGERTDIEKAIRKVSELVVRGKAAKENRAVWLAHVKKFVAIGATALTSFGLGGPVLNALQQKDVNFEHIKEYYTALPLIILILGALLIVAIILANHFMKEYDVEKKAVLSIALSDSFVRLGDEVRAALPYEDPKEQLEKLYEDARALQQYSEKLMVDSTVLQQRINDEVEHLISNFCDHWAATPQRPPGVERS